MSADFANQGSARPPVVVIGLESIAGLQAARIFQRRGVPVIGIIAQEGHPFGRTNVCDRLIVAETGNASFIEALRRLGPELSQRAVVVPAIDPVVHLLATHQSELEQWFHLALPPLETVEMLMNKSLFREFAVGHGLPIPQTATVSSVGGDLASAVDGFTFPLVVKPPVRDERWTSHTKIKAFKVTDFEQLRGVCEAVSGWTDELLVQEWIEGGEDRLFSCNAYFDKTSEALASFVARKLRQWPPETGMSSLGEECRDDVVLATTLELFQAAGFHGLAYLEMKQDSRTGEHYIVEPNVARATGRSAIAEAGGVELLMTMYCDLIGAPLPEARMQRYGSVKWIYLRWDLQAAVANVRNGNLTLRGWLKSLRGPKAYAVASWSDPKPFVFDMLETVKRRWQDRRRSS